MVRKVSFLFVFVLLVGVVEGYAQEYVIGKVPEWVEPISLSVPATIPQEQVTDGVYYVLVEKQIKVEGNIHVKFYRFATKIMNQVALREESQLSIDFDPTYQTLILHCIKVHRKGQVIHKLKEEDITLLHRETELEYQIYDGAKTASIILEDVQIGDIIEYSYSLKGANPVFASLYFDNIDMEWGVSVHRIYARLLWPKDRKIFIKNHNFEGSVLIKERENFSEYIWDVRDIPPLIVEDDLPSWYVPYGWVQLSETADWVDVVRWSLGLYQIPENLSEELESAISSIKDKSNDKKELLLNTLRFIQDEIRYLGIEIGPNSHAPTDPSVIFKRRFGDCKDKSFLMVTILNQLKIESYPALVNTDLKGEIGNWHPSPYAFNHVIVKVLLDENAYWLDPTNTYQRGSLDNLYQPYFGKALVISEQSRDLAIMPITKPRLVVETIEETLDLTEGLEKKAYYTVKTIFRGYRADEMRRYLARCPVKEVQTDYVNYYADEYHSIMIRQDMEIEDNKEKNEITVTEYYTIPEFWKYDKKKLRCEGSIPTFDLDSYIEEPEVLLRSMPLKVRYPARVKKTVSILLPEEWDPTSRKTHVENEIFIYRKEVSLSKSRKVMTVDYEFETRQDHVPVSIFKKFLEDMERVNDSVGHIVYRSYAPYDSYEAKDDESNWLMLMFVAIILIAVVIFIALWRISRDEYY